MKLKTPLLILASCLLVGCASAADFMPGGKTDDPTGEVDDKPGTDEGGEQGGSQGGESGGEQGGGSEGGSQGGESGGESGGEQGGGSEGGSQGGESGGEQGGGSQGGGSEGGSQGGGSGEGGGTIIDPETGEEIDLDEYTEYAAAPEGVTLTDWTEGMKAILSGHLRGYIPPFFFMTNMRVTYDQLEILQCRGDSRTGIAADYEALLLENGWAAYTDTDSKGHTHVYGRLLGQGFLIELDALDANGIFSINYNYIAASSSWPSEWISEVFRVEYESSTAGLPALVYENAQYIIETNPMFYEFMIYCMGAPKSMVEGYGEVLKEAKFSVQEMTGDYAGYWTALSRDRKVLVMWYYDGTGIVIQVGQGEGEVYESWEDCYPALNDFGRNELRLDYDVTEKLANVNLPEHTTYTINRDTEHRGVLQVVAHTDREKSLDEEDIINMALDLASAGYKVKSSQGVLWFYDDSHDYAFYFQLKEYYDDLGDLWYDLVLGLCDYRIFEGYYVYYGEWPYARVTTVLNSIDSSMIDKIPVIEYSDATYYVGNQLNDYLPIDIVNLPEGTLGGYKQALKDAKFDVTDKENGYSAVNREKTLEITCYINEEGEFHWEMKKYVASTEGETMTSFSFLNTNQLVGHDSWWRDATWQNGSTTFKIEMNSSSVYVGNYGDYIGQKSPHDNTFLGLRVYKGQKITVANSDGRKIKEIEFYGNDDTFKTNGSFDSLKAVTIDGAEKTIDETYKTVKFTFATPIDVFELVVGNPFGLNELEVTFA